MQLIPPGTVDPRKLLRHAYDTPITPVQKDLPNLFQSVMSQTSFSSYFVFLKNVRTFHPPVEELERYLSCFEQAGIIHSKEKFKQLFLYAIETNSYLIKNLISFVDKLELFYELIPTQNHPAALKALFIELKQINLPLELATIPNIFYLLENEIVFAVNSKPLINWLLEIKSDYFIQILAKCPFVTIRPEFLAHPKLREYYALKLNIDPNCISNTYLFQQFEGMNVRLAELDNFFKYAVLLDDLDLAMHIINKGLPAFSQNFATSFYGPHTLLTLTCTAFQGGVKIAQYLLKQGMELDQANQEGKRPLQCAIEAGNVPLICYFIMQCNVSIFLQDIDLIPQPAPFTLLLRSPNSAVRKIILDPFFKQQYARWPLDYWVPLLKTLPVPASEELLMLLEILVTKYTLQQLLNDCGYELFNEIGRLDAQKAFDGLKKLNFTSAIHNPKLKSKLIESKKPELVDKFLSMENLDYTARNASGTPLLFEVVEAGNMDLFLYFKSKGANLYIYDSQGHGIIHYFVIKNNMAALSLLLSLHFDINALDANGRSALYHAFNSMNIPMIEFLIKHGAQPFHLGEKLVTYLEYFDTSKLHLLFGTYHCWKMFKDSKEENFWHFMHANMLKLPRQEVLEIFFLFPLSFNQPHKAFSSRIEYLNALLDLHKKYPHAPLEYFYRLLVNVNPQHYKNFKKEKIDIKIPFCRKAVDLARLKQLFESINWVDPAKPGYRNPNKIRINEEYGIVTREDLLAAFNLLVTDHIPKQNALSGIPPNIVDRSEWYKTLVSKLKHNILLLEAEPDIEKRTKYIIKLFGSFTKCGGAWDERSSKVYTKLTLGKKVKTIENLFTIFLGNRRHNIVVNLNPYKDNQHPVRQYLRLIGKDYAIPQTESIINMDDGTEVDTITFEKCQFNFENHYTPEFIIKLTKEDFFEFVFLDDHNSALMEWFKIYMPTSFNSPKIREVEWAVKCLQLFSFDKKTFEDNLINLFNRTGIKYQEGKTVQELIDNVKFNDFWCTHVRVPSANNTFVLKLEAVVYFLTKFEVLSESFEGLFADFLREWHTPGTQAMEI